MRRATLLAATVALGALAGCLSDATGDFALCCTCLDQRSPINDAQAVDSSTNCLPDATADSAGEAEQCNQEAADAISDPGGAHPIHVVDELCTTQTCLDECRGATLQGATFAQTDQSLSQ